MDNFDNVGLVRKRNAAGEVVQRGLGPNAQEDVPIDIVNNGGYLFAASLTGVVDSGQADADNAAGNGIFFKGAKGLGQMQAIEKIKTKLGSAENARLQEHYDALVKMRNNVAAQMEGSAPDVGQCGSSVPPAGGA